mgnify:CR=1 FL=1
MIKKKLYTIEDAKKLSINEIHEIYKNFINPKTGKAFKSVEEARYLLKF